MPRVGLNEGGMLGRMRETATQLLPDTCTIQAPTTVKDGKGGFTQTWAAVSGGTNVACRLDPLPAPVQKDTLGGREAIVNKRQMTFAWDAPVAFERRIVIGGETYEIVDMVEDHSWRTFRRAMVTKVEGA